MKSLEAIGCQVPSSAANSFDIPCHMLIRTFIHSVSRFQEDIKREFTGGNEEIFETIRDLVVRNHYLGHVRPRDLSVVVQCDTLWRAGAG